MDKKVLILAAAAFILLSLLFLFGNRKLSVEPREPIACTMDAKLCPDGSYVGRVPPDCEFAPCP